MLLEENVKADIATLGRQRTSFSSQHIAISTICHVRVFVVIAIAYLILCDEAVDSSCKDLGCDNIYLEPRRRQLEEKRQLEQEKSDKAQEPTVHVGSIASGDMVMKSAEDRDRIARREGVIAFEMEGAVCGKSCLVSLSKGYVIMPTVITTTGGRTLQLQQPQPH
ncbi:uncharacterized protein TrAFT101_011563 [Trichoderma asperellum]|uniref:uncharacterized protein n=1 Tax=Trichoderma asperellum TaxID=101201 RepID=UPI00332F1625|nr:hypothetical protein TrAFT101_011563 [Trichoderma asperellum]